MEDHVGNAMLCAVACRDSYKESGLGYLGIVKMAFVIIQAPTLILFPSS